MSPSGRKRRQSQALAEYDLVLHRADGEPLDAYARAHDVNSKEFQIETRSQLAEGQELQFALTLEDGDVVRGRARVIWLSATSRGSFAAGVKIAKLGWRDRRRLSGALAEHGYDFVQLARNMAWSLYWIIVAVGAHNLFFHQHLTVAVFQRLIPVILALVVAGWAILTLLG